MGYPYTTLQQQEQALAILGHPDESWSTDDLPIIALATLIEGTHDRQKILDIDPETHTALVIHGVASADQVAHARIQELASPPGANPKYLLDLTIEGLRWTPAVVVAIDKLPPTSHRSGPSPPRSRRNTHTIQRLRLTTPAVAETGAWSARR